MSRVFKIKFVLSPSKIRFFICFNESPIKMMKNVFHFILKAFFRSQDIQFFVLTFWPFRKDGLIRKVRLISNFMTLQPGQQTITIQKLRNIPRSKSKQATKFRLVIEDYKRNIFLQKSCRKWAKETSFRPLFFKKIKALYEIKQVVFTLVSVYFNSPQLAIQ